MGVQIDIDYQGELHCVATHGPSQDRLSTDAPLDNHGRGQHFSPTDLLATALGTCMLTTMGIAARVRQLDLSGARAVVVKEMGATPRRHVAKLMVSLTLPAHLSPENRATLLHIAETCPVAVSLAPSLTIDLSVTYI